MVYVHFRFQILFMVQMIIIGEVLYGFPLIIWYSVHVNYITGMTVRLGNKYRNSMENCVRD